MHGKDRVRYGHIALVSNGIPVQRVAPSAQVQRAFDDVANNIAMLACRQRLVPFADAQLRIAPALSLPVLHRASTFRDLQDFDPDSIVLSVFANVSAIPAVPPTRWAGC